MNVPRLYVSYREGKESVTRGPFFAASPDGVDTTGQQWVSYCVINKYGTAERITVPWYHSLFAYQTQEEIQNIKGGII